jgi:hypothetical protein
MTLIPKGFGVKEKLLSLKENLSSPTPVTTESSNVNAQEPESDEALLTELVSETSKNPA